MKKCIAMYLRISQEDVDMRTNRAKDESNSIAAQRQLIQRHIEQNPYLSNLTVMEFCDDGFSGTNFERPDFQRMIELVRAGEIHIVMVKDLSRFGRDYLEVGDYLEHIFPFLGVRMISINDHYDSERFLGNTAGMDIAFRNLIYDYYSKDLSKKVKSAMRTKQRNGGYVTCCTYGYKVDPKNKHKMIIDPVAAPIVRRIFTDVIAGKSTSQVARELNAEGVPTPMQHKGTKPRKDAPPTGIWTHNRILDMLKNLKYTGCMVNNLRESPTIRAKSQRRTSKDEWIIHENAHEAIVTMEEFEAAQAALRKVKPHTKKAKENVFPYYCAHCGRKLQRTFGTDEHFYCVTPYWSPDNELCKLVRWDRTDIEDVVFETLKGEIAAITVETVSRTKEIKSEGILLRERIKVLTSDYESYDSQRIQSYMDYREGRMTREEFVAARSEREKRQAQLKEEIAQAEAEYEKFLKKESQANKDKAIADKTSSLSDEALREYLYAAVERINVTDNEHIEIVWKFDDVFATA